VVTYPLLESIYYIFLDHESLSHPETRILKYHGYKPQIVNTLNL